MTPLFELALTVSVVPETYNQRPLHERRTSITGTPDHPYLDGPS